MALTVILVECDVTSPAGAMSTLRFCDRAIFPMSPDDPLRPNAVWDERLIEPPSLRRSLFDDLQSLEPGLGVGEMVLANADRALDPYQAYVWGEVRVWRWTYGTAFSTARALITGPAAGTPAYDVLSTRPGRVRLTLYDYRLELERPLQTTLYGGDNNGTTIFVEGDASLKGKPKPLAWGRLLDAHIPAPPVNHEIAGYQLHDGGVVRFTLSAPNVQIFDRGGDAGILAGGDDLSVFYGADLETFVEFNVTSSQWYAMGDLGLLKFNANPVGALAFGFKGERLGGVYVETPGPVIARMLGRLGVPPERIGASFGSVACGRVVGAYTQEPTTGREMIGWVARSGPLAVLPDRAGVWQATLLAPAEETADHVIEAEAVLALEADDGAPRGAGEFSVGWDRIWTTYRRDNLQPALLGTPAEIRLAEPYRFVTVEDAAYKARYPAGWRQMKIETALRLEADAEDLADVLKGLFGLRTDGRPRRQWRVTLEATDDVLDVELGATVALEAPQFGVDDVFLLIGEEPLRPRRDQTIWTLWG